MERPIDRFIKYLKEKGIGWTKAERESGLGNAYIQNSNNRKGDIGSAILNKITETYPDLDIYWLITGKGDMLVSVHKNAYTPDEIPQPSNVSSNNGQLPHCSKTDNQKKIASPTASATGEIPPLDAATRLANVEALIVHIMRRLSEGGL